MGVVASYEIWTTAKGEQIRIVDMTDLHLVNAIFYLLRKQKRDYKYACDHVDDGTTIASASDCMPAPDPSWFEHPQLESLMAVAKSRGIKIEYR